MVQLSSSATHSRMSQISISLFPAALKMQDAESAFERMKKHYGDAVVLQDTKSLKGAEGCRSYGRGSGCGEGIAGFFAGAGQAG
jgi:hypothetical protein